MSFATPGRALAVLASAALLMGAAPLVGTASAAGISESPKASSVSFDSTPVVSVTFDQPVNTLVNSISLTKVGEANAVAACGDSKTVDGSTISCTPGQLEDANYSVTASSGLDSHTFPFTVEATASVSVPKIVQSNDTMTPVTGSFPAASSVAVSATADGVQPVTKSVTPDVDGGFQTTLDLSSVPDGSVTVTALATDVNGGTKSATTTVLKDTIGPEQKTTSPSSGAHVQPVVDGAAFHPSVTFTAPVTTAELVVRDGTGTRYRGTSALDAAGTTVTFTPSGDRLNDGAYSMTWTATDADGNASDNTQTPVLFTIDGKAPAVPTLTVPTLVRTDLLARGTAEAGSTITIVVADAQAATATATAPVIADSSGGYEATIDVTSLADGPLSVTAVATDRAGNSSAVSAPSSTTKDASPPAKPTVAISPNALNAANASAVTVSGTSAEAGKVSVALDDTDPATDPVRTEASVVDGAYTFPAVDARTLSDGTLTASVTLTDTAGNVSDPGSATVAKDTDGAVVIGLGVVPAKINAVTSSVTVTGSTESGASVSVTLTDKLDATSTVAATVTDTSFTATVPVAALADGTIVVSATATDSSGNRGASTTAAIVKDTAAPAATIDAPDASARNASTYIVTGTTEPGATVAILITDSKNATQSATAVVDQKGGYTETFDVTGLAQGALTIAATATDGFGNSTLVTKGVQHDSQVPLEPTVGISPSPVVLDAEGRAMATVSGAVAASDVDEAQQLLVRIAVSGSGQSLNATAKPDATGAYSVPVDLTAFEDGPLQVVVTVEDALGNTSSPGTGTGEKNTVTLDVLSTTPTNNVAVQPTAALAAVFNERLQLSGSSVTVTNRNGTPVQLLGETLSDDERTLQVQASEPLLEAASPFTVAFTGTDRVGEKHTETISVIIDKTAPAAPTVSDLGWVNAADAKGVVVSGTAQSGATLALTIADSALATATGTAKSNDAGAWSSTIDLSGLTDGALTVTATATDVAGNTGPSGTGGGTKDTVAATISDLAVDPQRVNGETTSFVATGSTEQSAPVAVTAVDKNGKRVAGTVIRSAGAFSATVPVADLADGLLTVEAVATDTAGNPGTVAKVTLDKDTVDPAVTLVAGNATATTAPAYTTSGTTEPGSTVAVVISDGTDRITPAVTGLEDGSWTSAKTDLAPLAQGPLTITATATDAFGNVATTSKTVQHDSVAPVVPVVSALGTVNTAGAGSVGVSGTAETLSTITVAVTDAAGQAVSGTATADKDGAWSTTLDLSGLADGALTAAATATDAIGNTGPAGSATGTKDTAGPVVSSLTLAPTRISAATAKGIVTGTTEAGAPVQVTATDQAGKSITANDADGGSFSIELPVGTLADGPITVSAVATDAGGNAGAVSSVSGDKDTVAPAVALLAGDATATTSPGYTTSGTVEPGSTVSAVVADRNGKTVTLPVTVKDGSWSSAATDLSALAQGALIVTATATDAFGNNAANSATVQHDTVAPVVTATATDVPRTATGTTVTGTSDATSPVSVAVTDAAGVSRSATAQVSSGSWTATLPTDELGSGPLTVRVQTLDAVGNAGTASAAAYKQHATALTVDAPTSSIVGDAVSVVGTLTRADGTALAGQTVQLWSTDATGTSAAATTTESDGGYTFAARPSADTTWTVYYDGRREDASAMTKRSITVAPRPVVTPPPPPASQGACPTGQVPEDGFADVAVGTTHETAIDCVVWWQVARGRTATSYFPFEGVTRGQMATFVANLITSSGGQLPASPADRFGDDNASPHQASINRLAQVGIVGGMANGQYGADLPVKRDQMATFLVKAYEYRTSSALPTGPDAFTDDNGTTHEVAINKAAAAGFTTGVGNGAYNPRGDVRRDQMASFVVRVLDKLVRAGQATTPR